MGTRYLDLRVNEYTYLLVLVDVGQFAGGRLLADNRDAVWVLGADLSALLEAHF